MKISTIYGPPGTGKTTKLMALLEVYLDAGYSPEDIAFVSFTKKGAYEGRDRAVAKFGLTEKQCPYFRTLHSIAFHEVHARKDMMLNWKDYKYFSTAMGMNFLGYYSEKLHHNDDRYLFYDVLARNNSRQGEAFAMGIAADKCAHVSHNYRKFKKQYGKYDFTDLIEMYNRDGAPLPVKIAIVDEAQDLSTLQWTMVWRAFANCEHVYFAGDDDQAIYEWSGADVDQFIGLAGARQVLDLSYRLPTELLKVAKRISGQIARRVDKPFLSADTGGSVNWYKSIGEVQFDKSSWLCLARNNWFLSVYDTEFQRRGMVYYNKTIPSVAPSDLKLITLYSKIHNETRTPTEEEAITLRRVCEKGTNWNYPWHFSFNWTTAKKGYYLDLMRTGITEENRYNVNVSTIHGVKGGEADNVVLLLDCTKAIVEACGTNLDSELRCLYVACTRAKKNLHIVHATGKTGYNKSIIQGETT